MQAYPYYIISDMIRLSSVDAVTGYWNGSELVLDTEAAFRYESSEEAVRTVTEGQVYNFYDPIVHKVKGPGRYEVFADLTK